MFSPNKAYETTGLKYHQESQVIPKCTDNKITEEHREPYIITFPLKQKIPVQFQKLETYILKTTP